MEALNQFGCKNIIFSSTAAVYGDVVQVPVPESSPKGDCKTPYGRTKSMVEDILEDISHSDPAWNIVSLRYFNPVGAHPSGKIGEDPHGIPNNLMPYITQVAVGRHPRLKIFGNDYDTHDGTGVRDYIHVMDLAAGHVSAIQAIEKDCGLVVYNLGTGIGYSVLDVVHAFQRANQCIIPYEIQDRRSGDIASCWSDPTKAYRELNWKAQYGLEDMCRDAYGGGQQPLVRR